MLDRGKYAADRERIKRLLLEHKNVSIVAELLGVHQRNLSTRLNKPPLRDWWLATKKKWKQASWAGQKRRWRQRQADRSLQQQAAAILAAAPQPLAWTGAQINVLLRAGRVTEAEIEVLARARALARAEAGQD